MFLASQSDVEKISLFLLYQPEHFRGQWSFPLKWGVRWCNVWKWGALCSVKYPAASVSFNTPFLHCTGLHRFLWTLQQWNFYGRARCDLRGSVHQQWAPALGTMHYLKTLIQSKLQGTPFVTLSDPVSVTQLNRSMYASWRHRSWGRAGRCRQLDTLYCRCVAGNLRVRSQTHPSVCNVSPLWPIHLCISFRNKTLDDRQHAGLSTFLYHMSHSLWPLSDMHSLTLTRRKVRVLLLCDTFALSVWLGWTSENENERKWCVLFDLFWLPSRKTKVSNSWSQIFNLKSQRDLTRPKL